MYSTEYLARVTMEVVDFAMESPCFDRGRKSRRRAQLIQFITNVVFQSEANIPALLVALVYIKRSEPHLCVSLEKWACERLFLGALIVASKVCQLSMSVCFILMFDLCSISTILR